MAGRDGEDYILIWALGANAVLVPEDVGQLFRFLSQLALGIMI